MQAGAGGARHAATREGDEASATVEGLFNSPGRPRIRSGTSYAASKQGTRAGQIYECVWVCRRCGEARFFARGRGRLSPRRVIQSLRINSYATFAARRLTRLVTAHKLMRLAARRLTRLDLLLFVLLTLTSLRGYHMRDEALTSVRGEQADERDVLYHTQTHTAHRSKGPDAGVTLHQATRHTQ